MKDGGFASDRTSLTLLDRAKDGSEDGWHQMATLYAPLIACWGRQKGLDGADLDDLVQEVFASLVASISAYEPSRARFRAFLYTITIRRLIDLYRRSGREHSISGMEQSIADFVDDDSPSSGDALLVLFLRALELVQETSRPRAWYMFEQTMLRSATAEEVAREMNVKVNTVIQARGRIVGKIRRLLADEWNIDSELDPDRESEWNRLDSEHGDLGVDQDCIAAASKSWPSSLSG